MVSCKLLKKKKTHTSKITHMNVISSHLDGMGSFLSNSPNLISSQKPTDGNHLAKFQRCNSPYDFTKKFILPSAPLFYQYSPYEVFLTSNFTCIFLLPYACYMFHHLTFLEFNTELKFVFKVNMGFQSIPTSQNLM
jgi:hypothetical protein